MFHHCRPFWSVGSIFVWSQYFIPAWSLPFRRHFSLSHELFYFTLFFCYLLFLFSIRWNDSLSLFLIFNYTWSYELTLIQPVNYVIIPRNFKDVHLSPLFLIKHAVQPVHGIFITNACKSASCFCLTSGLVCMQSTQE